MRRSVPWVASSVLVAAVVFGTFATRAQTRPAAAADPPYDWKAVDAIVGSAGTMTDDVYTYVLPRADLDGTVDGMAVPAAAGVQSEFRFFRCSCGKMRVVGQFCCADYEANDVVDAIRPGALIQVGGMGPMFTDDRPHLTVVRFQGEGDATALAKLLKSGLGWMGVPRGK